MRINLCKIEGDEIQCGKNRLLGRGFHLFRSRRRGRDPPPPSWYPVPIPGDVLPFPRQPQDAPVDPGFAGDKSAETEALSFLVKKRASEHNQLVILLLFFSLFPAPLANAATSTAKCAHSIDPSAVQVEWTAFKTSAKTPVRGSFKKLDVTAPKGGASTLRGVLERSSISFDPREIETGDPARDATLRTVFFGLWKEKRITAKILSAELNAVETSGALSVRITANGVRKEIPMKLRALEAAASALPRFIAEGLIHIADFDLQGPFATLHSACEKLHTGPDGVSKTWDMMEIRFMFPVVTNCVATR